MSLPDKRAFYSECYLEDITDKDYTHAQKMFKELKLKNLGDHHDLYVESDTLLFADVFENFRNKYIEIYELDPAHFLSARGLAWQFCLKIIGVRLKLSTNIDMLLMVEKERVKMNKPIYLGVPVLNISKTLKYKFWYGYIKQKLFISKLKIFTKTLLLMFKNGLAHLTLMKMVKNHFEQVNQKVTGLFKDEL